MAAMMFGLVTGGANAYNEPHWSFRDGCAVKEVTVSTGGYKQVSYDHCKSLPRIYSGKAWTPTQSKETLPSA